MTKSIPAGWHSVTPRLVAHDVSTLVDFLKQAFGGTGDFRLDRPCEIRIGDSLVMVSEVGVRDAMPAFLYLYVDDIECDLQTCAGSRRRVARRATRHALRRSPLHGERPRWQHLANRHPQRRGLSTVHAPALGTTKIGETPFLSALHKE